MALFAKFPSASRQWMEAKVGALPRISIDTQIETATREWIAEQRPVFPRISNEIVVQKLYLIVGKTKFLICGNRDLSLSGLEIVMVCEFVW